MTDTATRLAALDVDELLAMHERIDTHGPADAAIIEAHHLVTTEILRRGLEHGHDGDAWAEAAVEIDSVSVDGPDDIDAPEGMAKAWNSILADGGTVSVVLTVDGYVLKADPSVGDVHVDTIMGGSKRKKRLPWPLVNDEPVEKADGHPVPNDVQAAARQALKWITDGRAGDGFTSVGRGRARQLADGGTVDTGTLVKMRAYFARHIVDKDAEDWGDRSDPTPGMVAWYAWGGDAGRAWANRILSTVEKAYDPEMALTDRQRAVYAAYEAIAEQHGEFGMAEAHYMAPADNPFANDGMRCSNCVFFEGGGGCEILPERVEADALCKFWVISDDLLKELSEEDFLRSLDDVDKDWYGQVGTVLDAGGDPDLLLAKAGGNPEALRDYWRGGGKGKISWGAGGDFTSCVAAVGKYMTSEQAKGYCAIRHREVTGMWPGDKRNRMKKDAPSGVSVLTLPDGATYTINPPVEAIPVAKHGSHDQSSHGRKGGGSRAASTPSKGGAAKPDIPPLPSDGPVSKERTPAAAKEARALKAKATAMEPGVTAMVVDRVSAHGGEMEGLKYRLKSTDSLARKIDADAVKEHGGDRKAAAGAVSDAIRYTAKFDDDNYTDGVAATLKSLEDDGYSIRAKNFWQKGDPYQGMNVKATKDGVTIELQFHTRASVAIKEKELHPVYEEYRAAKDNKQRWKAWNRMTRIATRIPEPRGYERLLSIGTLTMQQFETAQQAGVLG